MKLGLGATDIPQSRPTDQAVSFFVVYPAAPSIIALYLAASRPEAALFLCNRFFSTPHHAIRDCFIYAVDEILLTYGVALGCAYYLLFA